jgi:class 3 adenylate cyclase
MQARVPGSVGEEAVQHHGKAKVRNHGQRTTDAPELGNLTFSFLLAVDVEGFSQRYAAEQARVQDDLEDAITQAATNVGLARGRWYRQPRGDGELAVLPQGVNGLSLVVDYPHALASAIAEVNRARNQRPRLRIRLAIHHGAVVSGRFGPVGTAPIVISRLVDAEILRQQLRKRTDLDIALIVSGTVYDEVVQSRLHSMNPEAFRRAIVRTKGVSYIGYLYQDTLATQDHRIPLPRVPKVLAEPPSPTAMPTDYRSAP